MNMFLLASRVPEQESLLRSATSAEILLLVMGALLTVVVAVFMIVMIGRKQFHDK